MTETTEKSNHQPPTGSPQTVLGKATILRGEFSGNGDLLIEGQFEGSIALQDHCVTVGTDGQVKAEIRARQVTVLGSVSGNISAREKVAIHRTGQVVGDLVAAAIAIEEGAYFKGSIEILREESHEEARAVAASSALGSGS